MSAQHEDAGTQDQAGRELVNTAPAAEEKTMEAALSPRRWKTSWASPRCADSCLWCCSPPPCVGPPPIMCSSLGPPGLGKTTLAMTIAAEMGAALRITSGPAIQHAGDLAAILSSLTDGEVLFIDEIDRMSRPAEEMLNMAMEDFRVDIIVVGKGAGATSIPLELPPFTLVGATTRAGLLPGPLRDRFGFTAHLEFYSVDELHQVLRRSASMLNVNVTEEGFAEIASRSRGTPRISNRLLRRVRDWALVHGIEEVDQQAALAALNTCNEVDSLGLDRLDRAVLDALCTKFRGGPVGLSTLAILVGEETETVESVAEPFLVREGLLARTPRGRIATDAAWEHLGLAVPERPAPSGDEAAAPKLWGE